jgi:hypothetical protein
MKVNNSTLWKWLTTVRSAHHNAFKSTRPDVGVAFFPEISAIEQAKPSEDAIAIKRRWREPSVSEIIIKMKAEFSEGLSLTAFSIGMIKEVAESFYEMVIKVERLAILDFDGCEMTEWRICDAGKFVGGEAPAVLLEPSAVLRQKFRDAGKLRRSSKDTTESDRATSDLKAAAERVARFTKV